MLRTLTPAAVLLLLSFAHGQSPTWVLRAGVTFPRHYGAAYAYDPARQVLVQHGGATLGPTSTQYHADVVEWDGATAVSKTPSAPGRARAWHAMAYDGTRVIAFGGWGPGLVPGTWGWDGKGWALLPTTRSPPLRAVHAMVFDAFRRRVVLFGGLDANSNKLGDTWEWDGANWVQRQPTQSPPPDRYTMAYDVHRRRTVLFDGQRTWEWDGVDWSWQRPVISPPYSTPRWMNIGYDSALQRVVLVMAATTWEWDGRTWTQAQSRVPVNRSLLDPRMVFDAAREELLLLAPPNEVFAYERPHRTLASTPASIPAALGGVVRMTIDGGVRSAGRPYWVIGSVSGSLPGFAYAGFHVPLNFDAYTVITAGFPGLSLVVGFRGLLDARGYARATLFIPNNTGVPPGIRLHHAVVIFDPATGGLRHVSNPVELEFR